MAEVSEKKQLPTLLLCFFFGFWGLHRFYVGKIGTGVLWLLTGGILGIGVIIDFIMIIIGSFTDKEGKRVEVWTQKNIKLSKKQQVVLIIIGLFAYGLSLAIVNSIEVEKIETVTPELAPKVEKVEPVITEKQKLLAIGMINLFPEVLKADVIQEGKRLSLTVIVTDGTSKEKAKQIGEAFVRQVKDIGPEPAPGKMIGKGMFDYVVYIYYPDKEAVVIGAKADFADHITW